MLLTNDTEFLDTAKSKYLENCIVYIVNDSIRKGKMFQVLYLRIMFLESHQNYFNRHFPTNIQC